MADFEFRTYVVPSNDFSLGKVKKNKRAGTAKLSVEVPEHGEVGLGQEQNVKGANERADAGTVKLAVKPKGKARKKLDKEGQR